MQGGGLDRKVEYGLLTSFYGALLTERQRAMLQLYCDEDLSVGEVAAQLKVTRQCVSDTLLRAGQRLDRLERSLGLMARFDRMQRSMSACREHILRAAGEADAQPHLKQALRVLDDYLEQEEA